MWFDTIKFIDKICLNSDIFYLSKLMLCSSKRVCEVLLRLYIYSSDVFIVGQFWNSSNKILPWENLSKPFLSPERIRDSYISFSWGGKKNHSGRKPYLCVVLGEKLSNWKNCVRWCGSLRFLTSSLTPWPHDINVSLSRKGGAVLGTVLGVFRHYKGNFLTKITKWNN